MNRTCNASLALVLVALLTGCASDDRPADDAAHGRHRLVEAATPAERAALIDRVKTLEGEWEMTEQPGVTVSRFEVSSAGSIVRETMFPGTEHEMTNVYHMDGDTLVMTHYCAAGNQPRMRASMADVAGSSIAFQGDSVTDLHADFDHYMAAMTLHLDGPDRIRQEWRGVSRVAPEAAEPMTFHLRRR